MARKYTCHKIHCQHEATFRIVGVVPAVTFTDGTTYPSQGRRLLGYSCPDHAETVVQYFARLGHEDVQAIAIV